MNKFLQKLAKIFLGLSMAAGVGVAIGSNSKEASPVSAGSMTYSFGTVNSQTWTAGTRTYTSCDSNVGVSWTISNPSNVGSYNSGNYKGIQLGTKSATGSITITSASAWGSQTGISTTGYTKITRVELFVNGGANNVAQWSASIGGVAMTASGSQSKNSSASSWTDASMITFTPGSTDSGALSLTIARKSGVSAAAYFCGFKVYCEQPKTLSSIALSGTYPTTFTQGDPFSHSGMTVTATYSDSTTANVTSSATFSGYNMSTTGGQTVTVSYTYSGTTKTATYSITVNAPSKTLSSIAVTTAPTKTIYNEGESFDSSGMVVTATYSDNSTENVTSSCSFSPAGALSTSDTSITITYSYGGTSKTATQAITVNEKHGTSTHPYTVAEAIADIDAGSGTGSTGAYATGIVSNIATAYNSQYHNVSFDIVDEIGDSAFLRAYRCGGTTAHPIDSEDSVKVGDIVVVQGNLTYYSTDSLYEFSQGCTLEDITPNTISSLTVTDHSSKTWRVGDTVHTTDLSVVVNYSNIDPITVSDGTGVTITSGAVLSTTGSNTVSVSYTDSYGTQTGSVSINAAAQAVLDSVSITGTATADKNGSWDFSDLVVTGTSDGGTTGDMGDITEHCVLTSSNSTATPGSTKITVHVNYKQGTKEIDVTNVDATISNVEKYTDNIDRELTGRPESTSYDNWSGKKDQSDAIYAGNSAGDHNSVQIRSSNSNSGVVSTASGGDLVSVTIKFNLNTAADRTVYIYGNTSAYTSAADLYSDSTKGTLIGEVNSTNGSTQTVSVAANESYQYVGLRSKSNAIYIDSIEIVWANEIQIKTLSSLSVTTNPTKTTYAAGETLSLTGLVVTAHYQEQDVQDAPTVDFETSPVDGYTFTTADGEAGSKTITITSTENSQISTSFTVTVTPKIPTALNRTTAATWTDTQTLADGAGRWKAVFSDASELTNIKIGDANTVLKIGGVAVNTSSLAKTYAGQEATLEYTSQNTTVSNTFTVAVTDELSVDSFEDVPEYVLVTETSELITANFTSLNGEPDSYSVTSSNASKLSVSFDSALVDYNSSTKKGYLYFQVTAGNAQGEYDVIVSVTLGQRTESKSVAIIVRGEAPAPAGVEYQRITSLDDVTTGKYIIATSVSGTYYALPSISTGKITAETVTVSNDVISETDAGLLPIDITKTSEGVAISKTAGNTTTYLTLPNSADFGTSSSAQYYNISLAGSGKGGTFKIYNSTSTVRALTYRTGTTNKFAPYAQSNLNGSEYYAVELFKQVSTAAEKTSFDWVLEFVDGYMYMNTISVTDLGNGACKGENGYYLTAKRAWNTMVTSYTTAGGLDDLTEVFEDSFPDAYARYMAWASACGDVAPFTGTTIQSAKHILITTLGKNTNTVAIIVIISMVSVTAIGGYFFLRKRKENI